MTCKETNEIRSWLKQAEHHYTRMTFCTAKAEVLIKKQYKKRVKDSEKIDILGVKVGEKENLEERKKTDD